MTPKVMVKWLTFLLRIRVLSGLNLGRRPAILAEVFRSFPRSFQVNAGTVT
jgi:hypothetical protein